eukprot:3218094-Alexandrium_andersonii.AAC.1
MKARAARHTALRCRAPVRAAAHVSIGRQGGRLVAHGDAPREAQDTAIARARDAGCAAGACGACGGCLGLLSRLLVGGCGGEARSNCVLGVHGGGEPAR